jgi:hypothetical protein
MNDHGLTTEQQRTHWERKPDGKVDRSTISRIARSRATGLVSTAIICAIALISAFEWITGGRL